MSRSVTIAAGKSQITLPNKRMYNAGQTVTLTDAEFAAINPALIPGTIIDNGVVPDHTHPGSGLAELIEASLGANVAFGAANTFTQGLSVSLTPGTWRVEASTFCVNTGGWLIVKLHTGATIHAAGAGHVTTNGGGLFFSLQRRIIVPAGANQTVALSAGTDGGGGHISSNLLLTAFNTGASGNVTRIMATREA